MTLTCPKCGKQIDGANINVAQDMAFCAPCGEMHKISALTAAAPSVQTAAPQAKTQFCTKCGAQLNDGIKFCAGCGSPVGAAAQNTEQGVFTPAASTPVPQLAETAKGGFGGFIGPLQMDYNKIPFMRKRSFLWGMWIVAVSLNLGVSYIGLPPMFYWVFIAIIIAISIIGLTGDVFALRDGSVYKYKSPKLEWGCIGFVVAFIWIIINFL